MRYLFLILIAIGLAGTIGCMGQPDIADNSAVQQQPQQRRSRSAPPVDENDPEEAGDAESEDSDENAESGDDNASTDDDGDADDASAEEDDEKEKDEEEASRRKRSPRTRAGLGGGVPTPKRIDSGGGGGGDEDEEIESQEYDDETGDEEGSEDDESDEVGGRRDRGGFGSDDNGQADADSQEQESFWDRAQEEFAEDHEEEGFQYLYGHLLSDRGDLRKYGLDWYAGLNSTRLALRWGVGIEYRTTGDVEGDPPVIGPISGNSESGESNTTSGSGGGSLRTITVPEHLRNRGSLIRRSEDNSSSNTDSDDEVRLPPREELLYYTGDYGQFFLDRLQARRTRGFYGDLLADVETELPEEEPAAEENPAPPGGGGSGDFVSGMGGGGMSPNRPGGNDQDSTEADASKTGLLPGAIMLGRAKQAQLISKAQAAGVDVLAVFHVHVRKSGSTNTVSETELILYRVHDGEQLCDGRKLMNTRVDKKRESTGRDTDDDPVQVALDQVFQKYADEQLKASDFQDLASSGETEKVAAYVEGRIGDLVSSRPANPLAAAAEIMYFYNENYLDKLTASDHLEQLLSREAAVALLEGDDDSKREELAKWMPDQFEVRTNTGDGDFR